MKKLLLASVALSGLAFAAPAYAGSGASSDINLTIGGYFKGYGVFTSQDETAGVDVNGFDFVRDTEIHIGGETTLDNGLTVGAHFELHVDANDDGNVIDESYVYFSGNWGRVNFGSEDGAAYLLQVAAPSADSNLDGIRQYIAPFANTGNLTAGTRLDYDQTTAGKNDKLTYLSPVMNGVQLGLSFTPDVGTADDLTIGSSNNTAGATNEVYEIAIRYEGQFQNVGVIAGAGYGLGVEDGSSATTDDLQDWNVGLDLDIGPFGIGAVYATTNNGSDNDTDTIVLGVDYTTGPFKLGASYLTQDTDNGVEFDRYTAGVTYEYGPGMSFRGSIQHLEQDNVAAGTDADGTSLVIGTQINF